MQSQDNGFTEQIDTARRIRGKALDAIETALDEGRIDPLAVLRVVADTFPASSGQTRGRLRTNRGGNRHATTGSIGPTVPEPILDAEMNWTRRGLSPTPPPRGVDEQLAGFHNPPPSDVERAESLTITPLIGTTECQWPSETPRFWWPPEVPTPRG